MHSPIFDYVFVALTLLNLALHLFVSGSAALSNAKGLLSRSQTIFRSVAERVSQMFMCTKADNTAYEDAVRQSLLLRRKQVWGNMCHLLATFDLLLCVCSIGGVGSEALQSAPARLVLLTRWAVSLFGARFHNSFQNSFGDYIPTGCYLVTTVMNCALCLMGVGPFYVTLSVGPASAAVLSSVAVPGNGAVLLSFWLSGVLLGQEVLPPDEEVVGFQAWYVQRCLVAGGTAFVSWVLKEAVVAGTRCKVEMSLSSAESTAVRAALYSVCDATVELDKDLLILGPSRKLADLLVRTSCSLEGKPFSDLIMRDEDKVAFEHAAHSDAEDADVVVSRMDVRDSIGTPVHMEVCRVPFKHLSKTRHLIGMWEAGRKKASEGEALPARDDVVQFPADQHFPVSSTTGELSPASSDDSFSSHHSRSRSKSHKRLLRSVEQALSQDVFAVEGLTIHFDCTFTIISYMWPDSRRIPGCGDKVVDFLAASDGNNVEYFEAHDDCCEELVDAALVAGTSDTISMEFESTWMLQSQRWADKAIRAKARINIIARTTSCAVQSERLSWSKSNIVMEATFVDVLLFKLKPSAQSL